MSLADRVNEPPIKRKQCLTCIWYDGLPDTEKRAFDQLAARENLAGSQFHRMCIAEGLVCGESSFKRHLQNGHVSR